MSQESIWNEYDNIPILTPSPKSVMLSAAIKRDDRVTMIQRRSTCTVKYPYDERSNQNARYKDAFVTTSKEAEDTLKSPIVSRTGLEEWEERKTASSTGKIDSL